MNHIDKENLLAVQNFEKDITCLQPLYRWLGKFNLFDVLKITNAEIRHSNMLAWLLNPEENHGLGDRIIKKFLKYVSSFSTLDFNKDCKDFCIYREWHNIDILAVSHVNKVVIVIENKVWSYEHDNQLYRYQIDVDKFYSNYKRYFVYLTPDCDEASDADHWYSMGYVDVIDIIESACKNVNLAMDVKVLIQNYVDAIRRNIVMDNKDVEQLCREIYVKHQKALDLIYEYIPDDSSRLATILQNWVKNKAEEGEIIFDDKYSNKTFTRFTTKAMSEIMPDSTHSYSGWGSRNYYFYEIRNYCGEGFNMQLVFSSKDIPRKLRVICDRINNEPKYRSKLNKVDWQWRTCKSTKKFKVDNDLVETKIFRQLDEQWKEMFVAEKEIVSIIKKKMT